MDWHEVGKYLAVTLSKEEITNEGLLLVVPRRKIETNRNIAIANLCDTKNDDEWLKARQPGNRKQKKMLALAISEGIRACMSHHVYCLGDRIYLQLSCGPIGLELTVAVSRPFMWRWDKLYLGKVKNAGINIILYKSYLTPQLIRDQKSTFVILSYEHFNIAYDQSIKFFFFSYLILKHYIFSLVKFLLKILI